MTINSITLVGRVGGDPDVRYFDSGKVKCRVSLAVDRPTKDDRPDWFNLEFWDKSAEVVANYVRKGSLIGVTGYVKIDTWQDRGTGAQRSSPIVNVDTLRLLGSKRDNDPSAVASYNDEF
ncbi:MAG: single-stranded DNA-binding protein [Coleofasciculaceae cyanobacterium RL_1_1]|nr:single-stranded DNA-binding protein [Coleofasciculaceae cyanobacterium RL_1_1]